MALAGRPRRSGRSATLLSGELFRLVFEASPVGISLADEHGHFVAVNEALCVLLGRDEAELVGSSSLGSTHPDDKGDHGSTGARIEAAPRGVLSLEKRYVRPAGEIRWGWLTLRHVPGPRGQRWTLAHVQDITERKAAEQLLADSERNLAAVAALGRRIRTGSDARVSIVAAALEVAGAYCAALLEVVGDELVAVTGSVPALVGWRTKLTDSTLSARAAREGAPLFVVDYVAPPDLTDLLRCRSLFAHPVVTDGAVVAVLLVGWEQRLDGMSNRQTRAVGLLADEASLALRHEALMRELTRTAGTDALTGLPNRRDWDACLRDLLASARGGDLPLTVAVADLDRFKRYNDEHGHPAGDAFLVTFAAAGRAVLRAQDVFARWGGEEFAVALPGTGAAEAAAVLERLRAVVPYGETCSVGVATWDGVEDAMSLLTRADAALYEAKSAGRDRLVVSP